MKPPRLIFSQMSTKELQQPTKQPTKQPTNYKQPDQKLSTHFSKSNNFVDGRLFTTIIIFAAVSQSRKERSILTGLDVSRLCVGWKFQKSLFWSVFCQKKNTQQVCLSQPGKRVLCINNNCASGTFQFSLLWYCRYHYFLHPCRHSVWNSRKQCSESDLIEKTDQEECKLLFQLICLTLIHLLNIDPGPISFCQKTKQKIELLPPPKK